MSHSKSPTGTCLVCGKTFPSRELIAAPLIRANIANDIRAEHPDWSNTSSICQGDLARYRGQYVHSLLISEKGELSELEKEVLLSLQKNQILAADVDSDYAEKWTFGQRLADQIATFGGSWTFLILFGLFIVVWIMVNSLVLYWRPVDPFPFILLNLVLSCLAAVQAPVIMMRPSAGPQRLSGQPEGRAGNPPAARKNRPPAVAPMGADDRNPGSPAGSAQRITPSPVNLPPAQN
jgi:hypothetical protein